MNTASVGDGTLLSVRVVVTSNDTLSGLTTRDGVTLSSGDLVLAVGQTDATTNGPYIAQAGTWTRIISIVPGQEFNVLAGSLGAGKKYTLTTLAFTFSITGVCSTNLSFDAASLPTQSGVTPGSYTSTNLTVNNKGIITAVSNGGGGGSTPALPVIYIGSLGANIIGFTIRQLYNQNASMAYPFGGANAKGSPDAELGCAVVDNTTVKWAVRYKNFTNTSPPNSLILRKLSTTGVWSDASSQTFAAGDQYYTGTITLNAGEAWGAYYNAPSNSSSGFDYFAFYGA